MTDLSAEADLARAEQARAAADELAALIARIPAEWLQRGDVLLRFISYLYASSGRVLDYSFSYFLPGYFRFHVVRRVG